MDTVKKKAVIFGASQSGLAAKKSMEKNYHFSAFIDNDETKADELVDNLPVYEPSRLSEIDFDVVLVASEFAEQITSQLIVEYGIPADRIVTLSAHQIKPFHFADNARNRSNAEMILGVISAHLQSAKIKYYVDAGTLLGIYRDSELIPWDDDLDFAVDAAELEQLLVSLDAILAELRLVTGHEWRSSRLTAERTFGNVPHGGIRSIKLNAEGSSNSFPMVDFFLKYINKNIMDYSLSSRGIRMPSRYMTDRKKFIFKNRIITIPSDTENYLAQHYGDDWREPIMTWNLSMLKNSEVFK